MYISLIMLDMKHFVHVNDKRTSQIVFVLYLFDVNAYFYVCLRISVSIVSRCIK